MAGWSKTSHEHLPGLAISIVRQISTPWMSIHMCLKCLLVMFDMPFWKLLAGCIRLTPHQLVLYVRPLRITHELPVAGLVMLEVLLSEVCTHGHHPFHFRMGYSAFKDPHDYSPWLFSYEININVNHSAIRDPPWRHGSLQILPALCPLFRILQDLSEARQQLWQARRHRRHPAAWWWCRRASVASGVGLRSI